MLEHLANDARKAVNAAAAEGAPPLEAQETGVVTQVGGGIARVRGLPGVTAEELVTLEDGLTGLAVNLDPDDVGVVLLGDSDRVTAGSVVYRTGRIADTPVGDALLGRVVDALGRPLDDAAPPACSRRRPVERPAPPIMDRAPVVVPLQTGLTVVDALIPIGRGQRELILGDRQTGKTSVAVDAIINQRGNGVVCIYCAIGQRGTAVARVVDTLRRHEALEHTIVVVAAGDDPPGLQFLTPYAATAMAEHFMDSGRDVLIVYDDLTRHARAYRELSLLLRRPPGREAFPGDIFYIHSRLLERATRLRAEKGGGSLTALPVVETEAQDMSAYIPTNLISITDGQLYLSPELFRKGQMPAVDVGRSVSRVGGKTQLPAYRKVAADLRLAYSVFEELETFARFATRLDENTRASIERGRRVRAILRQPEEQPLRVAAQIAVLRAVNTGVLDPVDIDGIEAVGRQLQALLPEHHPGIAERIEAGETLSDDEWSTVDQALCDAVEPAHGNA
ncbi:MAG: alternate F1F0 ATPase, F1 subunit alpha [Ectothiorhodospiraceae bacterium]|jgi:F-type H+-transporting ATPase subunit alpha